jgi:hypothetical protein
VIENVKIGSVGERVVDPLLEGVSRNRYLKVHIFSVGMTYVPRMLPYDTGRTTDLPHNLNGSLQVLVLRDRVDR